MDVKRATRRHFLKGSVALAGLAVGARSASGQVLGSAAPATLPVDSMTYGGRSRFGHGPPHADDHDRSYRPARAIRTALMHTRRSERCPVPSRRRRFTTSRPMAVPPRISIRASTGSLISGLVDRPLVFTLDELMRLPAVSRIHYTECVANAPTPGDRTLDEMHGMVACSEWTGVPLSTLLNEVRVRDGADWVFAEGAEAMKLGASLPMGKAMDDVLVAYAQNGEPHSAAPGLPVATRDTRLPRQVSREVAATAQGGGSPLHELLGETLLHQAPEVWSYRHAAESCEW